MGLDISAYGKVEYSHSNGEDIRDDNNETALHQPDFPARSDGLKEGIYKVFGGRHSFRAGSYSGYNVWRNNLARMVGTTADAVFQNTSENPNFSGPFVELISFSDCEGFIGPTTSAKLAEDFAKWLDRARDWAADMTNTGLFIDPGVYWLEKYTHWLEAFKLAANSGVVVFH